MMHAHYYTSHHMDQIYRTDGIFNEQQDTEAFLYVTHLAHEAI